MAIKQYLGENALLLQSIQEKIYQLFSRNFDRLSIYDKYGFIWCLPEKFLMRLDVFLKSSTKFQILG